MAFGNIAGRVRLPGGISIGANIPIGVDPRKANKKTIEDIGTKNLTPRNSINRMLSNVKNSNLFSRPYLYYIFITPPKVFVNNSILDGIMLNCESVSIPGHIMATKEHKTYGLKREYAYDKLYELVTMSFYVSNKMHEFNFFNSWLNSMYHNGRVSYYDDYKGTIEIFQCSGVDLSDKEDLAVMMKVKLIDAYPKTITPLALGHGLANTIQKVSVNITYRDVEYIDYTKQDSTKNEMEKITEDALKSFTEVGTLLQDKFADLKLPKMATLLKKKSNFLPIRNLDSFFTNTTGSTGGSFNI